MEAIVLGKDVLLFKNVLKDVKKAHQVVLESKTNKDPYLGNWEDWRPWGQYSKFFPLEDKSYKEDNSDSAELVKECLDIFFNVLKIYKNNYMNEEYFEQHGFPKDFPTSLQELEDSFNSPDPDRYCIADVLLLESENTSKERPLSMDYHQDRRFWFGGVPHVFNFNIYTNDDYEGGSIRFINTHDAEKKKYIDAFSGKEGEYLLVDDFFEYKMEAGDAMLFRTDHYHAVTPVIGNKFYIRQFLSAKMPKEYWDLKNITPEEEFNDILNQKEKEGFENRPSMVLFDNEDSIILDSPTYADWHGVLVPCVLRAK
jgi:hypothetical protein